MRATRELGRYGAVLALVALVFSWSADVSAQSGDGASPAESVVRELQRALIDTAAKGETLTREERYAKLEPEIVATHDLGYIAQLTIRRQWRELDTEQRASFVAAFTRLSIMTYATRFASVGPGSFEIHGTEDAGGGRLQVRAAIVRPQAEDVSMDYILHETPDGWKIVNILADRVSDLALKRAQYQSTFADGGTIDDLIANLEAETDRL